MSNPFEDSDYETNREQEVSVKEGLLCPVCVSDFRTINELREHFETNHKNEFNSNTTQTKQIGSQIKDLLNKTKRILKNDSNVSLDDNNESIATNANISYVQHWRQQMRIGESRSHFDYFRKIRDSRIERYVIETNKLLIRLDKLITDAPKDPEKRKLHEKVVVQWANDDDVRLCPNCAKSFNLSRRRHHCRLCGGIMCHNCSQFLDFVYARKLISPTNLEESTLLSLPKTNMTRRGSSSSLLSIVNSSGDPHIRVCKDCKTLLNRRDQQIEDNVSKPILIQFYDKMREQIKEIERLAPLYFQMADSFSLGETNYNLRDAHELKTKLTKLAENVDLTSRKIAQLGVQEERPPQSKQLQLQNAIRSSVTNFLRLTMLGLPSLPTPEELKKLQELRRIEIEKRIQLEKQLALEEQKRMSGSPQRQQQTIRLNNSYSENNRAEDVVVSPDDGWNPEFASNRRRENTGSGDSDDPMLQQIRIIQNYIRQARDAHKYDELHMLEDNLKELEIEYFLQQHGNQSESQTNSS